MQSFSFNGEIGLYSRWADKVDVNPTTMSFLAAVIENLVFRNRNIRCGPEQLIFDQ